MRYLVLAGFFTVAPKGRGNWTEGKYPTLAGARERVEIFSETDNANNTFNIFLAGEPVDPENNADFVRGNVNIGFGRGSVARVSRCSTMWAMGLAVATCCVARTCYSPAFHNMRRLATSSTTSLSRPASFQSPASLPAQSCLPHPLLPLRRLPPSHLPPPLRRLRPRLPHRHRHPPPLLPPLPVQTLPVPRLLLLPMLASTAYGSS